MNEMNACRRGHQMTEANTMSRGRCRECERTIERARREARAAAEGRTLPPQRYRFDIIQSGRKISLGQFWAKVDKSSGSGCWLWTGRLNRSGYGQMFDGPSAHRVSYEIAKGLIPDGLELDHLCCTPACVNPDHLEPVTRDENARRRAERNVTCKNGHPWSPETTYIWKGVIRGRQARQRKCLVCHYARRAAKRAAEREGLAS